MIFIVAGKRCFYCTYAQPLYIWKVFSGAIYWTAAISTKCSNFILVGLKFPDIFLTRNFQPSRINRTVCGKCTTLGLPTLRTMADGNFFNIAIIFIANLATETTTFDHWFFLFDDSCCNKPPTSCKSSIGILYFVNGPVVQEASLVTLLNSSVFD